MSDLIIYCRVCCLIIPHMFIISPDCVLAGFWKPFFSLSLCNSLCRAEQIAGTQEIPVDRNFKTVKWA